MTLNELKEAIETGHKASAVLRAVLQELVDKHHCPEAAGFEGPETYSNCEACIYCLAVQLLNS